MIPLGEPDFGVNDDASEWTVSPAQVYRTDLENLIQGAIDAAQALALQKPSRTLSVVFENLDEAQLWLTRLDREGGEA